MLIEALEERFERVFYLIEKKGKKEEQIIKYWGDPGRYESLLGVTPRRVEEFHCSVPSIVFTHEHAYGYLNHGTRKRLVDVKMFEIPDWGRAEDVLKLYYEEK
jgi:hypothetical protein